MTLGFDRIMKAHFVIYQEARMFVESIYAKLDKVIEQPVVVLLISTMNELLKVLRTKGDSKCFLVG